MLHADARDGARQGMLLMDTLAPVRHAGVEPHVVEYLRTPPSGTLLVRLLERMAIPPHALLREKDTPHNALGLGDPSLSDDRLIDAMRLHPIPIDRPIAVSPLGVRLRRPSEAVLDILPPVLRGAFSKEDGEPVLDASGNRVARLAQ